MHHFAFPKAEHLTSRREIEALFSKGSMAAYKFPLRAIFHISNSESVPVKVLISVSKRHFKHAMDRNRVKRQLREAYRLNKHLLLDKIGEGSHVVVAFIWLSDEHFKSSVLHAKMRKLLLRIGEEL